MKNFLQIFLVLAIFCSCSTPSAIRGKLNRIDNFQQCLIEYLSSIGIIQFTQNNHFDSQESHENCDNLNSYFNLTVQKIYNEIESNFEDALDEKEATCMVEVFRYTKFVEYNVVATSAVQFQPNGLQELKNLRQISKNIFTYATMKCLITKEMVSDLFVDLANKINVSDEEFACIIEYVSERHLMKDIYVGNVDDFLGEQFMDDFGGNNEEVMGRNLDEDALVEGKEFWIFLYFWNV